MSNIHRILVIGSGTMGRGIAQVSAMAGYQTTLSDVSEAAIEEARRSIRLNLEEGISRGKVDEGTKNRTLEFLSFVTQAEIAAQNSDLIIEAVPEDLALKCVLWRKLHPIAPAGAIFASNTSGLPITEMGLASERPSQMIGMHFFNPVHKMKLVEVIRSEGTSQETLDTTLEVAKRMGKETVVVRESPGFVTSRMNALIGNEAFRMLEEGVASAEDIDKALKFGLNHPMGPFEMADLVGLDVRLSILRHLQKTLGELYRPSPLLERYVADGRLGRKVGRGVYKYSK